MSFAVSCNQRGAGTNPFGEKPAGIEDAPCMTAQQEQAMAASPVRGVDQAFAFLAPVALPAIVEAAAYLAGAVGLFMLGRCNDPNDREPLPEQAPRREVQPGEVRPAGQPSDYQRVQHLFPVDTSKKASAAIPPSTHVSQIPAGEWVEMITGREEPVPCRVVEKGETYVINGHQRQAFMRTAIVENPDGSECELLGDFTYDSDTEKCTELETTQVLRLAEDVRQDLRRYNHQLRAVGGSERGVAGDFRLGGGSGGGRRNAGTDDRFLSPQEFEAEFVGRGWGWKSQ